MKKYINIALSVLLAVAAGSCSKDTPFDVEWDGSTGKLLKSSLSVSLENEKGPRSLRDRNVRQAAPVAADFTVDFIKVGETEPILTYEKYSEMPEIVTLPVGEYTAVAHFGENPDAAWESPYYNGESDVFSIVKDDITDEVSPIVCSLANVRVSVSFDNALIAVMDDECVVEVKVGERGSLQFSKETTDKSGYFAYVNDSETLVAVFSGSVDGGYANETKSYTDVRPGNHYRIQFKLHDAGEEEPGNITGKGDDDIVIVDATVSREDMNQEDLDDGEFTIPDTMRPTEGDEPGKEDPTPGPGTDNPTTDCPSVKVNAPLDINKDNELKDDSKVEFIIDSYADGGIQVFTVKIDSNVLDEKELGSVGIPPVIDLINCDDELAASLNGFGFPVHDEVKGAKHLEFDINDFVSTLLLIASFNDAEVKYYNFSLTVTDGNGTTEKTLKLYNK